MKCLNYTDSVLGSVKITNQIIMVKIDRSVPYRIKMKNVAVKFFCLAKSNLLQSYMALCPQVRSRASQHLQVASQLCWLLCPATVRSVIYLRRVQNHTPSFAFRHFPPNSFRTGYVSESTLLISTQLSTDAVGAIRKVRVLADKTVEATQRPSTLVNTRRVRQG